MDEVCEKYLENGNDVFWAFMDLENNEKVSLVELVQYRSVSNFPLLSMSEKRKYHSAWL